MTHQNTPQHVKNQREEIEKQAVRITYRPVRLDELEQVRKIESDGFPADEAASFSTIQYRHSVAPELFVGAYLDDIELIGFINATCSNSDTLDHESLTNHEAEGKNVMIHSVCTDLHHRRSKVATGLLQNYIQRCSNGQFSALVLVCHDELKPLYNTVGFIDRGPSQLVHGHRPWYEMILPLPIQNSKKLLCPVERCRCIILRKGVGKLITRQECPLPAISNSPSNPLPVRCWLVPNPTSFENIGFSKPIPIVNDTTNSSDSTLSNNSMSKKDVQETRWLSCGACDFGPLGWTESSSNLAHQFSLNPTGHFSNVLFLLDSLRVFEAD